MAAINSAYSVRETNKLAVYHIDKNYSVSFIKIRFLKHFIKVSVFKLFKMFRQL